MSTTSSNFSSSSTSRTRTSLSRTTSSTRTLTISAMTTPFVQPPYCASLWKMETTSIRTNGSTSPLTLLTSNTADPNFSSCQPNGWNHNASQPFTFSPAVCPSDWVYYDLLQTVSEIPITEYNTYITTTFSMAYCCASGYSVWNDAYKLRGLNIGCYQTFNGSNPTTITPTAADFITSGSLPLFTSGIVAHQPYTVQWAASDTYSMTPSLPRLTHNMLVPTWRPGEKIPDGIYDRYGSYNESPNSGVNWQPLFLFLVIGLPLIGVTLISCCIWCGFRARDRKWMKRMEQQEIQLTAKFAKENAKERGTTQVTENDGHTNTS